jgi:hypothetical protein
MDKKISLEHAIRNIVRESIGGPNTDEFKGTPKAFLKPAPLIAPKKGDEHPDGSASLAQRGRAKITSSETMKEALAPKKGETQVDLGYDPAFEKTPEEKSRREAAKVRANKEALKTAKFDPNAPGLYSRDVPPTEKLKNVIQDTLAKSPVYKDIAGQKADDLSSIASNIPFVSAIGKAVDSAYYSDKAQPKITGKGDYLAAKGKPTVPDNKTQFEKDVAANKASESQKLASDKMKDAAKDAAIQIAIGAYLKGVLPKIELTPSLRKGDVSVPKPENPAEYDFKVPDRKGQPEAEIRKQFRQADIEASKFKSRAKEFEAPVRTEPSKVEKIEAEPVVKVKKADATAAQNSMKMDIERTRQSNIAAAMRNAEQFRKMYPKSSETTVPKTTETKTKDFTEPTAPFSKGTVNVAPETQKVSPAAREPEAFKVKTAEKQKTKPLDMELPTSKGELVTTVNKTASPTKKQISAKAREPEEIITRDSAQWKAAEKARDITPSSSKEVSVKPSTEVSTEIKTEPVAQTTVATRPEIETKLKPVVKTATETKTATATATTTPTKLSEPPPIKPKTPKEEPPKRKRGFRGVPWLPSFSVNDMIVTGPTGYVPNAPYLHRAADRATFGESASEERTSIENVARPGGKTRIGKQGQIRTKIIDENVKKASLIKRVIADKKNSIVNLHPKLKNPEADQN